MRKGVGEVGEGHGGINGDRELTLGGEQTIYRWCIMELYTWNLYNFIIKVSPPINSIKMKKREHCISSSAQPDAMF